MKFFRPLPLLIFLIFCANTTIKAQTSLNKESFETSPPAPGWTVSNTCTYNWAISSNKASDGVKSAVYSSSAENSGCTADLYSPLLTLTNATQNDSILVEFDFERTSYGSFYNDRIELQLLDQNKKEVGTGALVYRYYQKPPASSVTGFVRYFWKGAAKDLGSGSNLQFQVRIRAVSDNGYDMYMDNVEISHIKKAPAKTITVTAPNGGEVINAGSTYNVKWISTGISNVNIDFSVNGGVNWNSITTNYSATSQNYNWVVPAAISKTCKVRITDASDNNVLDESNNYFEIAEGKILTLTTPNGGESISSGSTYNIKWDAQNVSNINIDFSVNGGVNWTSIVTNADATQKNYNWIVPPTPSLTAKVKVTDVSDANRFDESNAYFTITQSSGILEPSAENNTFRFFPNPSTGIINFEFKSQNAINSTISVRDITGRVVYTQNIPVNSKNLSIDLKESKLSKGVFFVEFRDSEKAVSQKLILQ
jgi:hypothetical protein